MRSSVAGRLSHKAGRDRTSDTRPPRKPPLPGPGLQRLTIRPWLVRFCASKLQQLRFWKSMRTKGPGTGSALLPAPSRLLSTSTAPRSSRCQLLRLLAWKVKKLSCWVSLWTSHAAYHEHSW
eukprot:scaffold38735_cov69-Phaeocystis_antarctica.AAC.5